MKKLLLKEVYRKELFLSELSMTKIADTRYDLLAKKVLPGIGHRKHSAGEHKDIIRLLYEIEYKHSMLKKKGFEGHEQRRQNILDILEDTGRKATKLVSKAFLNIFLGYLRDTKGEYKYCLEKKKEKGHYEGKDKFMKNWPIIREIAEELKKIETLPFEDQMVLINRAKNAQHWQGSMLDHYEAEYEVEKRFFERMSNQKTDKWDKELREIGVEI